MKRRSFLQQSLAAATVAAWPAAAMAAAPTGAAEGNAAPTARHAFRLNYAPHFGMFEAHAGKDLFDQLRFMADQGFRALEDNDLMARTPQVQARIGQTLARLGMTMGVFVIDGGNNWKTSMTTGKVEFHQAFLGACRAAIETAKRVDARWATVIPGYFERKLPLGVQTGHVIDTLRAAADLLAPHQLTMVLEPLSDNADLFLRHADQAYAICRAVASPACKILYDAYHLQRNEGNLLPNITLAWDEIAYFQVGDNPGRNEPGTGEINYRSIFRYLHDHGYRGVIGMEHGAAGEGRAGEQALIDAYVTADAF